MLDLNKALWYLRRFETIEDPRISFLEEGSMTPHLLLSDWRIEPQTCRAKAFFALYHFLQGREVSTQKLQDIIQQEITHLTKTH